MKIKNSSIQQLEINSLDVYLQKNKNLFTINNISLSSNLISISPLSKNSKAYFSVDSKNDIYKSKFLNADCIEIHTGKICNLINDKKNYKKELIKIKAAVNLGNKLGLEVHAGHGLTFKSAKILSKVKGIKEFNIGHFLVGESIFVGLNQVIRDFKKILKK